MYPKFFKDKGFLPPLQTLHGSIHPLTGAASNIQGSRCPSVNSHLSGGDQQSNGTVRSGRALT